MDNGLTKNVFWLWFQDSGNFLCQILIFVSNSNFSYVLQQFFSPYGLTDCDSAPQLPAWWYVNDICWLYMAIIHISPACICTCMFCHYPVFTFSLVRTELGMLLYALRLQDQLHGFAVRDRHTPHFHHHLTDARSQGNFNGHLRQCATCPTSFKGCFSPFILIRNLSFICTFLQVQMR